MKKLIIFEFVDEIMDFISQRSINELRDKDMVILAIQPCAQAFLKRQDIGYLNTSGLIDNESHKNILLKSVEIVEPLKGVLDLKDRRGVEKGYNDAFIFCLRHYSILYILWLIEVIDIAVEKIMPGVIVAVDHEYFPDRMECIPSNERLLGTIVTEIAQKQGVKCELCIAKDGFNKQAPEKLKSSVLEVIKLFVFYISMFFILRYKSKRRKLIMYSSNSYNLKKVAESFHGAFDNTISVVLFDKPALAKIKKMFVDKRHWNMLSSLPCIMSRDSANFSEALIKMTNSIRDIFLKDRQLLCYKGVDFSKPVLLKIEKRMVPFLIKLHGQTYHLNNLIKRIKPALIISQTSRGIFYNMAEIASINNVPSIMVSHGSHVPPSNRFENIEWGEHGSGLMDTLYKYLAVQSPCALEYLRKKRSGSAQVITGRLLFTKIKDRSQKENVKKRIVSRHYDKKIILHAGTPKPFQSSRPYVYETVDEYINNINSLIKVVERIKDVYLIVRFRPSNYLKLNDFAELLNKSDCYSVHSEGSFADYLAVADILISYASTTIEEALQNRIPVLMYDPQNRYRHIKDAQVLDSSLKTSIDSCYYVNSEENLLWSVQWLLKNHLSKEVSDSVFKRHDFSRDEIVDLPVYFKGLFSK